MACACGAQKHVGPTTKEDHFIIEKWRNQLSGEHRTGFDCSDGIIDIIPIMGAFPVCYATVIKYVPGMILHAYSTVHILFLFSSH